MCQPFINIYYGLDKNNLLFCQSIGYNCVMSIETMIQEINRDVLARVGSASRLSQQLTELGYPITRQAVWKWFRPDKRIPYKWLAPVSHITGFPISRLVPETAMDKEDPES